MHVGQTLINHAPDASFPSDHMLIFSSIAFSYIFAKERNIGFFLFLLAIEVAWSRIYLGVHFPLDMLGALTVAFITAFSVQKIWNKNGNSFVNLAVKIYTLLFSKLINKGIIR